MVGGLLTMIQGYRKFVSPNMYEQVRQAKLRNRIRYISKNHKAMGWKKAIKYLFRYSGVVYIDMRKGEF